MLSTHAGSPPSHQPEISTDPKMDYLDYLGGVREQMTRARLDARRR
ncbi:MAG: hypothetical protein K2M65_07920 [Muribaculaceae bacterium]|nr:hypothetical protein [Muribaculaceae bacterium]